MLVDLFLLYYLKGNNKKISKYAIITSRKMSEDTSPYHNFSSKYPAEYSMKNWMKHLYSTAKVSTLSIPGAHDSGTYSCGKVRCCQFCFSTQCQIWSV